VLAFLDERHSCGNWRQAGDDAIGIELTVMQVLASSDPVAEAIFFS
jgi:hypothetical protein